MKHLAWIVAGFCCTTGHAEDYAYRVELAVTGGQATYRAALPAEVHRGVTRADFADLRVVNGAGEPVPFALISGAPRSRAAEVREALPLFPVRRAASAAPDRLELSVRQKSDGTLIALSTSKGAQAPGAARPAYWLLDASRLAQPVRALQLDWAAVDSLAAGLRVEAGDDLATWRVVAERAPLIDLKVGGQALRQDSVTLPALRARYLRLTVDGQGGPTPEITAVRAALATPGPDAPRAVATAVGKSAGLDIAFDLGGAFTVERVGFVLPQPNTLAPAEILVRDDPAQAWRALARTVVYRLAPKVPGNPELVSPPLVLAPTTARYWLLRLDPKSGGLGTGAPGIEAHYAVRHVAFVARGNGPFRVEYGLRTRAGERDRQSAPALALPTLLPDYREGDEWKLPEAAAGPVGTVNPSAVARTVATEFDLKKATLWALLVAAVALLGTLAWRLVRGAAPPW